MDFIRKLEKKFGKYAIWELPTYIILLYVAGYMMSILAPRALAYLTLDPVYILKGQIWRLVTWVIVPPSSLDIFTVIMLFFYYSIARGLVQKWGAFRFNLYYFSGLLFTVIGAFIVFAWYRFSYGQAISMGSAFNTYYINMSFFLAFTMSYPDAVVLLYFIIPVKVKWMGVLYGVLIAVTFFQSGFTGRMLIISSLLNFLIFWLLDRQDRKRGAQGGYGYGGMGAGGQRRTGNPFGSGAGRAAGQRKAQDQRIRPQTRKSGQGPAGAPVHRCAICGRTELDSDQLEFRYCSKCAGAYEYCQDHLFSHTHVKAPE